MVTRNGAATGLTTGMTVVTADGEPADVGRSCHVLLRRRSSDVGM